MSTTEISKKQFQKIKFLVSIFKHHENQFGSEKEQSFLRVWKTNGNWQPKRETTVGLFLGESAFLDIAMEVILKFGSKIIQKVDVDQ